MVSLSGIFHALHPECGILYAHARTVKLRGLHHFLRGEDGHGKSFSPIRVFGTIGFICTMWIVDILGYQTTPMQFIVSALIGSLLGLYAFTLPNCPISTDTKDKTLAQRFGLDAFKLFKERKMALFFIFSMLLGVSLQITNGFANPFIASFEASPQYAETFGVQHRIY